MKTAEKVNGCIEKRTYRGLGYQKRMLRIGEDNPPWRPLKGAPGRRRRRSVMISDLVDQVSEDNFMLNA